MKKIFSPHAEGRRKGVGNVKDEINGFYRRRGTPTEPEFILRYERSDGAYVQIEYLDGGLAPYLMTAPGQGVGTGYYVKAEIGTFTETKRFDTQQAAEKYVEAFFVRHHLRMLFY